MGLKGIKILHFLRLSTGLVLGLYTQADGQQHMEPTNIRFGVISSQQGLSQSSVFSLAQDHKGFIWIGTRDGLNRFDGYNFVTYKIDPQDTGSISNNEITVIHADRHGDIWIGTRGGGLNKYITSSDRFIRFSHLTPEKIIRDIYESHDGMLWVGSSDGLLKSDITEKAKPAAFVNVSEKSIYLDENGQLLSHQKTIISVVSINQVSKDTLLIGTELGMFLFCLKKTSLSVSMSVMPTILSLLQSSLQRIRQYGSDLSMALLRSRRLIRFPVNTSLQLTVPASKAVIICSATVSSRW